MSEIRVGDVLRYTPEPQYVGQRDARWCREGTAIVTLRRDGTSVVVDTYWGTMSDAHVLTSTELAAAEVLFNLDEYDEIDPYARSSSTWDKYAKADRQTVSSQHGLQHRWFIRKGAAPDAAMQIANAERRVADAIDNLDSAQRSVEWAKRDLAELRERLAVTS